jgi:hypothetical protein
MRERRTQFEIALAGLSQADSASALLAISEWMKTLSDGCRQGTAEQLAGIARENLRDATARPVKLERARSR